MTEASTPAVGLGSQIAGFAQVCAGLEVIDDAELRAALEGVSPEGWYPVSRMLRVEEAVRNRFPHHAPILFRAGEVLMRNWYATDAAAAHLRSGIDFLELQHDSAGYHHIVRGTPAEIGTFSLVSLDRERSLARVHSTTPFDIEYERGVLYGGTSAPGDMRYVKVSAERTSIRDKTYTIEFSRCHSLALAQRVAELAAAPAAVSPADLTEPLVREMALELNSLREQIEREREYFHAASNTLKTAMDGLAALTEQLRGEALTDPLTKVFNRRHVMRCLEIEVERSRRNTSALSLIVLDIDHFKRINDRHGHPTGDQVLVGVTQRVRAELRSGDILARIGGEEFLVLLPAMDLGHARVVAERLRSAIADRPIAAGKADPIAVTASLGVATLTPDDNAQSLIGAADAMLYAAKHAGRNRVIGPAG
jgi:diguanylate cyclase (GGDEF)-like protein